MSADLLARLIEAGTPAALVGEVAMALAQAQAEATADRRSPAAIKQQRYRDNLKADGVTKRNDVTQSVTRYGEGNATPSLDKEGFPQTPIQEIKPIPGGCIVPAREGACANRIWLAILINFIEQARHQHAVDRAVECWNAMAGRTGLATVKRLTPERQKRLRARLTEHGPDAFTEAIAAIERSSFCLGESRDGWRADFDFLLQASSFTKLIEGSYDRASRNSSPRTSGFAGRPDPIFAARRNLGRDH